MSAGHWLWVFRGWFFNFAIYGALLPPYYAASRMDSPSFSALLGVLFSPSRGLLIFTPVVLFAVSGFVLSLRERAQRPLHIAFAGIVVGITCIVVSWEGWSGGHCSGPRLMTDVVPFLVYFVMFNFHLPAYVNQWVSRCLSASIAISAVLGVLIHAQGALRYGPWQWNYIPNYIDTSRIWDWTDPQFLRAQAPP